MANMDTLVEEFETALLQVNRVCAAEVFERCYLSDNSFELLEKLAIKTLEKIGAGWENGSVSLSQVYMSGVICEELITKYTYKIDNRRTDIPKMAIAALQDHHALGKRMVYSVLRAGGFEVLDFGHGLSVEELVQRTVENKIDILLISTLMLPSALKVKTVKNKLKAEGSNTKIVVGGAPFRLDNNLWKRVDADVDGKSASHIIEIIERVVRERNE